MSKYTTFTSIVFKDRVLLLQALGDLGYTTVEQGEKLRLIDWHGQPRSETAEIVVRRKHLDTASNDLGFKLTEAGYVPIVSEYDLRVLQGGKLLPKLRTAYAERTLLRLKEKHRGSLHREVEGSVIKLRVRY